MAPVSGLYLAQRAGGGYVGYMFSEGGPQGCTHPSLPGFEFVEVGTRMAWCDPNTNVGAVAPYGYLVKPPPGPSDVFTDQPAACFNQSDPPSCGTYRMASAPADPGYDTVKDRLQSALDSTGYPVVNEWLSHQLDPRCYPDPFSSTVTVPSVLPGETPDDYEACLSTLGLSASPTDTLPDSQADWGTPSGDFVDTQPAPGEAVNTGTNVTIDANPATMPTPTQRETDLATALQTTDPGITDTNTLDVARSCLDLEDQATGNSDFSEDNGDTSFQNCASLPIFVTGYDAKSAGQHDEIALGENPATDPTLTFTTATGGVDPTWVLLHRYLAGWSRSWLTPAPASSGCDDPRRSRAVHCDEYPFASVYEGGEANNPNLQLIDGPQNTQQGLMLSGFYGEGPYAGLQGCNLPDDAPFLAIPVPDFVDVNTTWACNGGGR